jgi:hypothetical protein
MMRKWIFVSGVACLSLLFTSAISYWVVQNTLASQRASDSSLFFSHALSPESLQRVNFYLDELLADSPNDLFHVEMRSFLLSLRREVPPADRYLAFMRFSEGFPLYGKKSLEFAPHFVELTMQANQEVHSPHGL